MHAALEHFLQPALSALATERKQTAKMSEPEKASTSYVRKKLVFMALPSLACKHKWEDPPGKREQSASLLVEANH